jgi:hypothetical protein
MQVLGSESFLSIPDVNGQPVLLNGGGTGTVSYGTLAARPAASTSGNLYVDTTSNVIWRDTGAAWVSLSASGSVLQVVTGVIAATSGTALIPLDNTIPTSTEGIQIFTTTFTPLSATSKVILSYTLTVATNTNNISVATTTFSGTTNLGAAVTRCATSTATAGIGYNLSIQTSWAPGSTAAITVQGRVGALATSTYYVNSHPTAYLGGSLVTEYAITEVL